MGQYYFVILGLGLSRHNGGSWYRSRDGAEKSELRLARISTIPRGYHEGLKEDCPACKPLVNLIHLTA